MMEQNWVKGYKLPELRKMVTQANIDLYARASGDFNPIHIDIEFARKTPLGGTIAHGMLILAYVSESMTKVFGKYWLETGNLDVRFKTPARPGDSVLVNGSIISVENFGLRNKIKCDILCTNNAGETIISGETQLEVNR